jgi:hypothetical protein
MAVAEKTWKTVTTASKASTVSTNDFAGTTNDTLETTTAFYDADGQPG